MILQRQLRTLVTAFTMLSGLVLVSCVDQPSSATGIFTGTCVPDCAGKECGDDGCEGTCGECDTFCEDSGECCAPTCEGKAAGAWDGCGGCCPDCTGKGPGDDDGCGGCCPACLGIECGDDGCGGTCGGCDCGETCDDGICVHHACDGKTCGDDSCGGTCGSCTPPTDTCIGGVCSCVPNCAGKNCGPDGCGGVCGDCNNLYDECEDGICVCQPFCGGKVCGADGCGGLCGECGCGENCLAGECIFNACKGRECGADGCGESCGTCLGAQEVCDEGHCLCIPGCDDVECGDDGCGGSCGECTCGKTCQTGSCTFTACDGLECGDDGCGGSCGTCEDPLICVEGNCQPKCTPMCLDKDCGDDGCGGVCGLCGCGETCVDEQCLFVACVGKFCGDDGCGGVCGLCGCGETCVDEQCLFDACTGKFCGDDGCGGSCGTCPDDQTCDEELHQCICDTCCQDSSECGALEICTNPGEGSPVCLSMTPVFQANFDDEAAGAPSSNFTYSPSWPEYSPGWVIYDASGTPEFANSPAQSFRYNKYKSDGWMEFSAVLPAAPQESFISFMLLCPAGITPNWTINVKGDGETLLSISSTSLCGDNIWHHLSASVTSLGQGSHNFRFELDNEAFGTIYFDDVVILVGD